MICVSPEPQRPVDTICSWQLTFTNHAAEHVVEWPEEIRTSGKERIQAIEHAQQYDAHRFSIYKTTMCLTFELVLLVFEACGGSLCRTNKSPVPATRPNSPVHAFVAKRRPSVS